MATENRQIRTCRDCAFCIYGKEVVQERSENRTKDVGRCHFHKPKGSKLKSFIACSLFMTREDANKKVVDFGWFHPAQEDKPFEPDMIDHLRNIVEAEKENG